jgi:hypothetical protein
MREVGDGEAATALPEGVEECLCLDHVVSHGGGISYHSKDV